jgi:cyclohexa-1,5-dienecarbonyl-CoA hydratase
VSLKFSREEGGALLHLIIDAGKGNIVTGAVMNAIAEQLAVAKQDVKVRAVLLDAAGTDFSFGASVEEHRPAQAKVMIETFHALIRLMVELPVPLLVAVKGRCLGGAMELALAGSRIFAHPTAKLGQPEVKLAVFAPPASVLLPLRVGQAAAEDLLLSGRTVGAAEALELGLVDEVCAADQDPAQRAREYAVAHFFAGSASSLRFATRAARVGHLNWVLPALAQVERLYLDELMATFDAQEGIEAFVEKRAPKFRGA